VVSTSRRGLLLGGASLVLAGCGARSESNDGSAGDRSNAEALAAAIEVKTEAERAHRDPRLARIEREHIDRLEQELAALGVPAGTPRAAGASPTPEAAEERTVGVLQDLLPTLSDRRLRRLLASMLVADAAQLAVVRGGDGEPRAREAFLVPGAPA
jgi:hypothetical protein